jgi:hypothetical protein
VKIETGYMQKLRTIWIAPENNNLKIMAEFPEIIVPTDSNFWRVNIKRNVYNRFSQDNLYVLPLKINAMLSISGVDRIDTEECDVNDELNLNFIGNKYISITNSGSGFCQGNAHPSSWNNTELLKLKTYNESPNELAKVALKFKTDIPELLGPEVFNDFIQQGKEFHSSLSNIDGQKDMVNASPSCLYLSREKATWKIFGRLEASGASPGGMHEDFVFSQPPSKEIVGYDVMDFSWDELKSLFPDIQDAFMSPVRDVIGILAHGKITFYKINNDKIIKEPISEVELNYDGLYFKIVMLQWAVGKNVQRWTDYFKEVKENAYRYKFND